MSDSSPTPEGAFSAERRKAKDAAGPAGDEPVPVVKLAEPPRTPPVWRHYVLTVVLAAVVAAFVAAGVSIGVNVLFRGTGAPGGLLIQQGKLRLKAGQQQEVYYPIPFAGPPHLELEGSVEDWRKVVLKEQKADHFTVECPGLHPSDEVRWKAEGIRGEK
jgi:hypothetical protein